MKDGKQELEKGLVELEGYIRALDELLGETDDFVVVTRTALEEGLLQDKDCRGVVDRMRKMAGLLEDARIALKDLNTVYSELLIDGEE